MIGDILHERYHVVNKLESGGYSTVWLARDLRRQQYVAVKGGIADSPARDFFRREARALRALSTPSLPPNVLRLPPSFDCHSIEQLYESYGTPDTVPIISRSKQPLPPNVPTDAVLPLYLGKAAEEIKLAEVGAGVLLCYFGEAFEPASHLRRGKDCHTPLAFRAPEAYFEPDGALSYSSDIWGLATAIWEILGMKAIFSLEYTDINKIISQHMDVLGPLPSNWREAWEHRD